MDKLTGESTMRGTLMITAGGTPIPTYTGVYNVTPTQSQQTLETNGKKMVRDVKVAPIPSQYIIPEGTLEVTQNGQQSVREYENVNVNVPAPTGEKTINVSQNGTTTEDVANYATAKVVTNVPASAVDSGTKNINANGTHNVVGYASAAVNVPNSYAAADEGKVVSNGALVSQSSATYTENGTYDTTLKNEVVVDVQSGGGGMVEIASGTLTGAGQAVNIDIPLGKKMPQRNFAFRLLIDPSCTITSDGNYYVMAVNDYIAYPNYIDMSAAGTNTMKTELYINNGARMVIAGTRYVVTARNINSFTYSDVGNTGYWRYKRDNTTGFSISIQNFNSLFIFKSGEKYNWSLIYFGNDPTNDIVEIP